MEIKYDVPFEVNRKQYNMVMSKCEGMIAGMEENGRCYIKVRLTEHKSYILKVINEN
jgi:hypothetical protein